MKVIIVAKVGKVERTKLENIENQEFNSVQAILDEFPNDTVQLFTLSEFMDACNNSDDDTPKALRIDVANCWIGYVELNDSISKPEPETQDEEEFKYQSGKNITLKEFLNISIDKISQVYEGKRDCCRCGCGGEYIATRFMENPRSEVDTSLVETLLEHAKELVSSDSTDDIMFGDSFIDIKVGEDKSLTFYFNELKK
jgi:hypothetical protein